MSRQRISVLLLSGLLLASPAVAAGPISGRGQIEGKDSQASTLQIERTVYHITPHTVLRDAEGNRLLLSALRLPAIGHVEGGPWPFYWARFEAVETPQGLDLTQLDLLETPR